MDERIEAAEKMQEITGGNVWSKGNSVRIYLRKGWVSIDENCQPDIDAVKRSDFEDVRDALQDAGYKPHR